MQSRQHPNTDFSEVNSQLATNGFSGARKPGAGTPDAKKNREEKEENEQVRRKLDNLVV